jgi:amidase
MPRIGRPGDRRDLIRVTRRSVASITMWRMQRALLIAGFLGARYPFGVSFLGPSWSDCELLVLAHAYERATRHRRAPDAAR